MPFDLALQLGIAVAPVAQELFNCWRERRKAGEPPPPLRGRVPPPPGSQGLFQGAGEGAEGGEPPPPKRAPPPPPRRLAMLPTQPRLSWPPPLARRSPPSGRVGAVLARSLAARQRIRS